MISKEKPQEITTLSDILSRLAKQVGKAPPGSETECQAALNPEASIVFRCCMNLVEKEAPKDAWESNIDQAIQDHLRNTPHNLLVDASVELKSYIQHLREDHVDVPGNVLEVLEMGCASLDRRASATGN